MDTDRPLRRLGEMLKDTPKAKGTRGQLTGDVVGGTQLAPPTDATPTLADLGIDKKTSARYTNSARSNTPMSTATSTASAQSRATPWRKLMLPAVRDVVLERGRQIRARRT